MSRVVSDAGPLIHLAQIDKLRLLKMLFSQVVITPGVKREAHDMGVKHGYADAEIIGKAIEEGWIIVEKPLKHLVIASRKLAKQENISLVDAETILLAKEKKAEVLVDERVLSNLARLMGLRVWNTWTVLLESLNQGCIEVADIEAAIKQLAEKKHKLKPEHANHILTAARNIARGKG